MLVAQNSLGPVCPVPLTVRGIRVLRAAPARDVVFGAELLRRVRQRGRNNECGRVPHVLLPDPEAGREAEPLRAAVRGTFWG